jgi:ABC-type nitrate/sulfonate/bicarbonate transport system substrate-binding protein
MKVALPDLVSNSYFPALAAVELGYFRDEGLDMSHEMIFPVTACFEALRDGAVQFVAGSAHAPLWAFPRFQGSKLVCALSQGMYWFLVVRADLAMERGDLTALAGLRIAAAPNVDAGFRQLLVAAGIDAEAENIQIDLPPGGIPPGVSFGVAAAEALVAGTIDGFWANGMGAEVAVEAGIAKVVIDVRRGDGPAAAFNFTQPALTTTDEMIEREPDAVAGAVRAIVRTQKALKEDVSLATRVGEALFPDKESALIARLIERDLPFYDAAISDELVAGMNQFAEAAGMLDGPVPYDQIVATRYRELWTA